jgi:hypothetical protein
MAVIAAANFYLFTKSDSISVYTIGQPRTGNMAFVDLLSSFPYTSRIFRIGHVFDPIVEIMPPMGWFKYYHHGRAFQHFSLSNKTGQVSNEYQTTACKMNDLTAYYGESDQCKANYKLLHGLFGLNIGLAGHPHLFYFGWYHHSWDC